MILCLKTTFSIYTEILIDINTDEWSDDLLGKKMALFYSYKGAKYTGKEFHKEYNRLCKEEKARIKAIHPEYKNNVDIKIEKVFKELFNLKDVEAMMKKY